MKNNFPKNYAAEPHRGWTLTQLPPLYSSPIPILKRLFEIDEPILASPKPAAM